MRKKGDAPRVNQGGTKGNRSINKVDFTVKHKASVNPTDARISKITIQVSHSHRIGGTYIIPKFALERETKRWERDNYKVFIINS